ncbi:hypothetical protein Theth_1167 [Pseudothermotoga thermarum DSM 5069]|uniref:Uncharacterized protein n=1 Tax=Pseudothermotoga thermarum DSM 5069 TaxID=688269 RepID=F7YTL7_9THEM|nr:hypothetical protein Theth_1167 [Pseudothermotoga thermarum DSM 5069]
MGRDKNLGCNYPRKGTAFFCVGVKVVDTSLKLRFTVDKCKVFVNLDNLVLATDKGSCVIMPEGYYPNKAITLNNLKESTEI